MKTYKLLLGLAILVFLASCTEDPENTSVVQSFDNTISGANITSVTVMEGDTAQFLISFPNVNTDMNVVVTSDMTTEGSAIPFRDFNQVLVDAFVYAQDIVSISIIVNEDLHVDDGETIYLNIMPSSSSAITINESAQVLAVTVQQKASGITVPMLVAEWNGPFVYSGDTYDFCSNTDVDVYIVASGDANPYNDVTGYSMATGSCPETAELSVSGVDGLADGTYDLYVDLWSGLGGLDISDQYPMTISIVNNTAEVSYDLFADENVSEIWTAGGTLDGANVYAGSVQVNGDQLTLFSIDGTNLGSVGTP